LFFVSAFAQAPFWLVRQGVAGRGRGILLLCSPRAKSGQISQRQIGALFFCEIVDI